MKEKVNPLCFLRQTRLTTPCKIIKISKQAKLGENNLIEFAHKINLIVSNAIEYVGGSTNTSTSSKEALKLGKGCLSRFCSYTDQCSKT